MTTIFRIPGGTTVQIWTRRAVLLLAMFGAMLVGQYGRGDADTVKTEVKQQRRQGSPRKQMQTLMADARALISEDARPLEDREWIMRGVAREAEQISNFLRQHLRENTDLADVARESLGRLGHPRRQRRDINRLAAVDVECRSEDRISNLNAMASRAKLMRDELIATATEISKQPETPTTLEVRERAAEIVGWFSK